MRSHNVFVMMKPDAFKRNLIGTLLKRFESKRDLTLTACRLITPTRKQALGWYGQKDKSSKKDYPPAHFVANYLTQGNLLLMIWSGPNALKKVRQVVGKATDPQQNAIGTIRRDFGIDTKKKADKGNRAVENLVHASRSYTSAKREIIFWKNYI